MVKTTNAASQGAQSTKGVDVTAPQRRVNEARGAADQRLMAASALALSWQLALVVIVPILGGYLLDQHYHKTPLLTLAGLVVAMIGVFGVLSRLAIEAGAHAGPDKPEGQA